MRKFEEIREGDIEWRFDTEFLQSNWTCIWGRGCHGIGTERNDALNHGCCSFGAELDGPDGLDEARNLSAAAATIPAHLFQYHAEAARDGVFKDNNYSATRVVDDACIFLNRNGFEGGEGCALHLAAQHFDESPTDWKPSVCWQLPIKVDWEMRDDNVEVATLRGWARRDWGTYGKEMAWCCTEGPEAYVGTTRVIDSLAEELREIIGEPVYIQLRQRLQGRE